MNTRLYEVLHTLATAHGNVKQRVAIACSILDKMHPSELPSEIWERLIRIRNEAGKNGPLLGPEGNVIRDRYQNTIPGRRNRTYEKLAAEVVSICLQHLK